MGWNTELIPVADLNKVCPFLMVLKLNVWQGVCSDVRLDTNILIGISVWGLEGAKLITEKPHLTLFLSYIIDYSKNDFENSMKFPGAVFSYGQKFKNFNIGQN